MLVNEYLVGGISSMLAKLAAICFKHARTRADFLEIFVRWMDVVREVARAPNGLKALVQVMRYILQVHEPIQRETLEALMEREVGPKAKEAVVTAGQQLIEQGIQQERQQGRQRFQELLLRLLRQRFGNEVDANVERRVAAASVEQIETWTDRVLSAATLAELLAD